MKTYNWLASVILAAAIGPNLLAEAHCPASIASVPLYPANRYTMLVAVFINHSGPYAFLLDTGTQVTIVDPSLASRLHLEANGLVNVQGAGQGAGTGAAAQFAQPVQLTVGSRSLPTERVLVYDMKGLDSVGLSVKGILGEDFLQHFDVLIDNDHHILCLDDSGVMRSKLRGSHVALAAPQSSEQSNGIPPSLIIRARLSDGMRLVNLNLDSGTNTPFLYHPSGYLAIRPYRNGSWYGGGVDGKQRAFKALPPQNVKIGQTELSNVLFLANVSVQEGAGPGKFDGLLPTGLFRRIFICSNMHYVVIDPKG